jgi:hypothetical protein
MEDKPLTKQDLLDALNQIIPPIINRIDSLEVKMDKRFDAMEKRQDVMDGRLDGMDRRLNGVDKQLGGIDRRLGNLEREITDKPGFEDVRNIVREETHRALSEGTYRLVPCDN